MVCVWYKCDIAVGWRPGTFKKEPKGKCRGVRVTVPVRYVAGVAVGVRVSIRRETAVGNVTGNGSGGYSRRWSEPWHDDRVMVVNQYWPAVSLHSHSYSHPYWSRHTANTACPYCCCPDQAVNTAELTPSSSDDNVQSAVKNSQMVVGITLTGCDGGPAGFQGNTPPAAVAPPAAAWPPAAGPAPAAPAAPPPDGEGGWVVKCSRQLMLK